jgi:hypothetical protein
MIRFAIDCINSRLVMIVQVGAGETQRVPHDRGRGQAVGDREPDHEQRAAETVRRLVAVRGEQQEERQHGADDQRAAMLEEDVEVGAQQRAEDQPERRAGRRHGGFVSHGADSRSGR